VPALPPYIIEPIWEQFVVLLPQRNAEHPWGSHRPRIPDRVIFEKLVQVLVFGCAYRRIADGSCSATTLRRRRDEWIEAGAMDALEEIARDSYDRIIGLELSEIAVDCCITKAPCGGEGAGKSPVDREREASNALWPSTEVASRLAASRPGQPPRLAASARNSGAGEGTGPFARRGEGASGSRLRLRVHPRAASKTRLGGDDLRERQAGPVGFDKTLGGGAPQLLAKRPQEACMVYRETRAGHRLLGFVFQRGNHRGKAHQRGMESLPLGETISPQTMTYWPSLLVVSFCELCTSSGWPLAACEVL
jgi:transposase